MDTGGVFERPFWHPINSIALYWTLFGLLVALLLPDIVLQSIAVREIDSWIVALIPTIDTIASLSSFPDLTLFFYSTMWLLFPLMIATFFVTQIRNYEFYVEYAKKRKRTYTGGLVIIIPTIVGMLWMLFGGHSLLARAEADEGSQVLLRHLLSYTLHFKAIMGLAGAFFFSSVARFLGSALFCWFLLRKKVI